MRSEKRIEGTNKDKTVGMSYSESMWGTITTVAAVGLLGAAAYKTGHAKKAVKSFISKASSVSNNSSIAYTRAFRNWMIKDSSESSSLLRGTLKDALIKKEDYKKMLKAGTRKEVYKDVKDRFSKAISKEGLSSTINDVKDLEKMAGKSKKHLNSLSDSNIVREFNEIEKVTKGMKKAGYKKKEINSVRNSMMKDFIKDNTLTDEARAIDMKRKGYTSLTLGDLFDIKSDHNKNGRNVLVRKSSKFNEQDLSILENKLNKSFIDGKRGKPTPVTSHKDILKLKIDSALLSDGKEVADLRMFRSMFDDVTNSLAKDFKIPIIGINPFSIMGVHEIGKKGPSFAMLKKGTVQSAITGSAKHTSSDMFFSKGSVYNFTDEGLVKIKSNMSVEKIHAKSAVSSRTLDATRKMNGTRRIEYNDYTDEDGAVSNMYGKLGKWLDFGFDDIDVQTLDDIGTGEILNPNHWIAKITNKFKTTGFLRPNKGVKQIEGTRVEKTFNEMFSDVNKVSDKEDLFIAINDGFGIMDLVKQVGNAEKENMANESVDAIKKYVSQFFAGRKNLDKVTKKTTVAHFMVDRVSSTLGVGGFGLSVDSSGSTVDIFKNLLLKRVLPVYAAYNAAQFAIMMTETNEDELGNKDNILKGAARTVAKADLVMHKGLEMFGISSFTSGLMEALPGIDHITELPGINALGIDQGYEERLKHHTEGYTRVRKNRYWDGGNQAFTGGKTDYFAPSLYRRIMADAEFSDTKWGSRAEYFMNAPFPNPINPLAPIKHFITDPYHYDKKHKEDRPYAVTSPLFQNIPFIGSVLSPTLGELIKPTKFTNPHIFNQKGLVEPPVPAMGNSSLTFDTSSIDTGDGGSLGMTFAPMAVASGGKTNLVGGFSSNSDDIMSADTVSSMSTSRTGISYTDGPGVDIDMMDDLSTQNQISYNANQLSEDAANFFGLYGFMATTAMGEPLDDKKYVENASYAYSGSRVFWNQSIGGLGGDTNEIARRFLRKRMHEDSLVNPISNNMPDWVPGDDYFTDFSKGDPYVKVANGELRLPGQAYERLHNIKKHDLYEIDASSLSSVDNVISSTLNKEAAASVNNDLRQEVLSMYRDNGRIVEGAGTITDYDRHLKAEYDAIVNVGDDEGMLFIGNSNDSKSTMIKAQVAMYATGQSMAFIQNVNENGERASLKRVDYDQRIVNDAMENMVKARDKIEHMKDIGQLSNGDMYSPLDRFRILADVAPYSNEFSSMRSVLSTMDLSDEEREEVADITERVQDVRKPLRLYDYKFLGRETTTDIKVIDSVGTNGTFTVVGDDKEYKLAGIDIKKQEEAIHQQDFDDIMNSFLHVGSTVKLEFDANPSLRFKGGYNRVIVNKNGKSLQEELLRRGLAEKNTSDDPLDTLVKTNVLQRTIGKAWESFAHADTPVHSKFLRVRSAKEDYERSRVYGKQFASWTKPISDYLIPLVFDRNVGRGLTSGVLMGGIVGGMFGKNAFGTFVGTTLGAGTVLAGKVFTGIKEEIKQETWRPNRVVKEQQLYDYMDKLKYVKYRKLYHEYADKAKKDRVNVEGIIGGTRKKNSQNKRKERWLKGWKIKQQKLHQTFKIPNSLLRLMPRADLNIDGLFKDEFAYSFLNMKKKLLKTEKEINRYLALNQSKMDKSKADKAPKGIANALKTTWSSDVLKEESDKRQKRYISEKMAKTRTKSIIPLRGNFRYDRKAPPSEKLDKLLKAKTILSSSYSKGLGDNDLKKAIKESGVIPVWRGALKSRNIDKDKTMQRLDYEIAKQSKKAGFSENAAKALEYYKMSENTMYAYDRGDSISDVASAMEKRDKDYFREFVNAKDDEKLEILDLVPKYMRRPLEAAWGLEVEEKDDLGAYFSKHALPDETWKGWDENVDLNNVKVKMAKNENLEFSDTNIWADDVARANRAGEIDIPILNYRSNEYPSRAKLAKVLGKSGYSDVLYNSRLNGVTEDVNLYLKFNKKSQYKKEIDGKLASNI